MSALGDALLDTWGGHPRLKSYTATGWHAQVTKLTESQRGYDAMARAGIDVTPRTLMAWLSQGGGREDFAPSAENRSKIRQAYDVMAGGWNSAHEHRDYRIKGWVQTGNDIREHPRGTHDTAPFLVDGRPGNWASIRAEWNAGTLDSDRAEDLFVEDVIENDPALDSTSDPWEFPGASYTIT